MDKTITQEKIEKYFSVGKEAFALAKEKGIREGREVQGEVILDMAERYIEDAEWFYEKGDVVNAFAALNYAHGWMDCGARLDILKVKNSRLFTTDDLDGLGS